MTSERTLSDTYQKKLIVTIYLLSFYCSHGNPLIMPLLPFIAQEFHLKTYEMGLMITFFAIPGCLIPFIGILEDRIGRRPMLFSCVIGSMLSMAIAGLAPNYIWLAVCRLFHGLFTTPLEALVYTLITDYFTQDERAHHVGRATTILFAGVAFIPVIITGMQYLVSWRLTLLLPVVMGLPVLIFAWESLAVQGHQSDNKLKQYTSDVFSITFSRSALAIMFIRMAVAMSLFGIVYLFLPTIVTDVAKVSPHMVGICFAMTSVTMSLASYSTNWHMTNLPPAITGSYGGILFVFGLICMLTSSNIYIIIVGLLSCGWVYGLLSAVGTVYYSHLTTPSTRGALMAIYSMMFRVAQAVGVTIMGFVFSIGGMTSVMAVGIVLAFLFSTVGGFSYHSLSKKMQHVQGQRP